MKKKAELLYGQPIRLPGEFFMPNRTTNPGMDDTLRLLKQEMAKVRETPHLFVSKDLGKSSHVFLRSEGVKPALSPSYEGPYKVLDRDEKTMRISLPNRETRVSLDRVKPAYFTEEDGKEPSVEEPIKDVQERSDKPYTTRSGRVVHVPERFQVTCLSDSRPDPLGPPRHSQDGTLKECASNATAQQPRTGSSDHHCGTTTQESTAATRGLRHCRFVPGGLESDTVHDRSPGHSHLGLPRAVNTTHKADM